MLSLTPGDAAGMMLTRWTANVGSRSYGNGSATSGQDTRAPAPHSTRVTPQAHANLGYGTHGPGRRPGMARIGRPR
eukprot:6721829-Pyramimonas_sp.AAC.1